jgi:hypothetical protein
LASCDQYEGIGRYHDLDPTARNWFDALEVIATESWIRRSAWRLIFLDRDARSYELFARVFDGQSEGHTRDDILDNITITWLTNTALWRPSLLGEFWQTRLFHCQRRLHPGCRESFRAKDPFSRVEISDNLPETTVPGVSPKTRHRGKRVRQGRS